MGPMFHFSVSLIPLTLYNLDDITYCEDQQFWLSISFLWGSQLNMDMGINATWTSRIALVLMEVLHYFYAALLHREGNLSILCFVPKLNSRFLAPLGAMTVACLLWPALAATELKECQNSTWGKWNLASISGYWSFFGPPLELSFPPRAPFSMLLLEANVKVSNER